MYQNPDQPTGISLIAAERQEQIVKHGFSVQSDSEFHSDNELLIAADFALHEGNLVLPKNWDENYAKKIKAKDRIGQLKVAGAFIAAEIDRLLYEAIPRCEYCGMIEAECICDDKVENNLELHKIIAFDELIEHGLKNGANVEGGFPLSWKINGKSITHKNNRSYLIETIDGMRHFRPGDFLIAYESGLMILINHGY